MLSVNNMLKRKYKHLAPTLEYIFKKSTEGFICKEYGTIIEGYENTTVNYHMSLRNYKHIFPKDSRTYKILSKSNEQLIKESNDSLKNT